MSLRTRLALVFIAATLVPLGATVWLTTLLLDRSLRLSPVDQLSALSLSLQKTGHEYYEQAKAQLKTDALAGQVSPVPAPDAAKDFLASDDTEQFSLIGDGGNTLLYLLKTPEGVKAWERPLEIRMADISGQYREARRTVSNMGGLRRGFFLTWDLLAAAIWLVALALVWLVATRFSRPIVKLTEALKTLAGGNFRIRVPNERTDEIGLATEAFNRTAAHLEQSRDRLVNLTQLASWQVLARKTAHEVKNSLTPIRLTVEEMVARGQERDRIFLEQAAGIVVDEIESLERRIRAFSEFSSEPPICPEQLDLHQIVEERIAFLKSAHPEVRYAIEVAENTPSALADQDLVKGILVNLLENAAEAAGEGGQILARVRPIEDRIAIEVHDSGPGLSELARTSLFQPTISFKKRGMGLGLSIARKSALLSGGDILLIAENSAAPDSAFYCLPALALLLKRMPSRRILVIDDEENIGRSLRMILEREGYQVNAIGSAAELRAFPDRTRIDLFLMDVRLPDASGIDLLRELQASDITAPIVMISGHATIADAVEATRAGAFDFLEKPLGRDRVMVAVKNALEQGSLKLENRRLREAVGPGSKMIGASPAFLRAVEQAGMAARSDARVLLVGESGTGKELLAAHIHEASPFAAGAFVKVNCAAIPGELIESELFGHEKGSFTGATSMRRGKFELADGGTLFLDEIGDLHANSQAKLLRVLQEGEFHRVGGEQVIRVTVRVVAATNRDLSAMVAQGKFREDLYYRVSVVPIRVPALRERPQDIRPMAEYFLEDFCVRNGFRRKSFDPEVWEALESCKWPGNARELRNAVERMAILSHDDVLSAAAIPLELRLPQRDNGARSSVQEARESAEREHVLRALEEAGWNVSSAARALGMERTNLHKRIRALGLARGK